jgi:hypothetical protein
MHKRCTGDVQSAHSSLIWLHPAGMIQWVAPKVVTVSGDGVGIVAARRRSTPGEPRWPVVAAVRLQVIALVVTSLHRTGRATRWTRPARRSVCWGLGTSRTGATQAGKVLASCAEWVVRSLLGRLRTWKIVSAESISRNARPGETPVLIALSDGAATVPLTRRLIQLGGGGLELSVMVLRLVVFIRMRVVDPRP